MIGIDQPDLNTLLIFVVCSSSMWLLYSVRRALERASDSLDTFNEALMMVADKQDAFRLQIETILRELGAIKIRLARIDNLDDPP